MIPSFRQISLVDSGGRRAVRGAAVREASGCGRYFKFVDDEHSCATNGATWLPMFTSWRRITSGADPGCLLIVSTNYLMVRTVVVSPGWLVSWAGV